MTKRVPIDLLASNFEARDTKENTTSDPETSLIINNRETSFTCQLNSSPYQIVPTKETVKCVCVCVCANLPYALLPSRDSPVSDRDLGNISY
jgi:hypothetical protein